MVNINNRLATLTLLFLLTSVTFETLAKAAITVTSSRNPVALDESFHLIYEADSSVDDDPDFSPIYKEFDVLSSSQSTNMRSINGSWSMKKSWNLTVIAKDIGKFIVPAINFGSDISPAIQVTVKNSSSPNSASPKGQATVPAKIFLETSVDKKSGWVQSQFIYTVRLMRTVSIANATLSDPSISDPDAIIEKLTEDNYQKTRNGITYEVFERSYAIFPQKSGTIKINPLTFEGRINASQARTIFDQFRMSGQLKRLRSKAEEFTVKSAPKNINLQDWLPSTNVQLVDQWSSDIQELKAGEPVTRTIVISAERLTGIQLPELEFEDIPGIKQYPDKAIIENRKSDNGIVGLKQIKVALIPASAGSYTLPEISLRWWNTTSNKEELATLPELNITVTGSAMTSPVMPPAQPVVTEPVVAQTNQDSQTLLEPTEENYWKELAILFAFAWLLTLFLYFKKSATAPVTIKTERDNASISLKAATADVIKQLKADDAMNTKNALIKWAQVFYENKAISNLSLITSLCSDTLSIEIEKLHQALYSPAEPEWNSEVLLQAFKDEQSLKKDMNKNQDAVLKPLYKH